MTDRLSVFPRFGCALLVLALVMFVITLGLFWYTVGVGIELGMNVYRSGPDVIKPYFDHLLTESYWNTWGVVLMVLLGITLAAPSVAFFEAKDFLTWITRRA